MRNQSFVALSLVSVAMWTGSAQAVTATTSFPVSATVISSCLVVATPLLFGNYSPTATVPTDAANTVVATCTYGTSYQISADAGAGSGASIATRKLTGGLPLGTLNYTLYSDAGRTAVWGNTANTNTIAAIGQLLPTTHNIYGRIFAGQNATIGAYVDVINVSLDY
jgi:spore coat protein U-like protein